MGSPVKYSIIVPVFNRPDEVDELLLSLTRQSFTNFEVLLVEDGSTNRCDKVYEKYAKQLRINYIFKPNSGPGPSRNVGYEHAKGDYYIAFDSDCIIPPDYLTNVDRFLSQTPLDAWGGPDRGHADFTPVQQAMAYTMSSVLTTGGIRGGLKDVKNFQPRSFNMGISKDVFRRTEGFKFDRYAEDIEFSIRIKKSGFYVGYIPDAYVFHKRRTNLGQFYRQVFNFGRGRVQVGRVHSEAVRITHWFPSLFLIGLTLVLILFLVSWPLGVIGLLGYALYILAIAFSAYRYSKSMLVGLLAGPSAMVQLVGYGAGFLKEKLSIAR